MARYLHIPFCATFKQLHIARATLFVCAVNEIPIGVFGAGEYTNVRDSGSGSDVTVSVRDWRTFLRVVDPFMADLRSSGVQKPEVVLRRGTGQTLVGGVIKNQEQLAQNDPPHLGCFPAPGVHVRRIPGDKHSPSSHHRCELFQNGRHGLVTVSYVVETLAGVHLQLQQVLFNLLSVVVSAFVSPLLFIRRFT